MTPTPQERTELQRLAEAAKKAEGWGEAPWYDEPTLVSAIEGWLGVESTTRTKVDAAFIAAANPAAILDLLAELKKEHAEVQRLGQVIALAEGVME